MFKVDPTLLLEAIAEVINEASFTKKRVFNRVKLTISSEVADAKIPKNIFVTFVAEPNIFGESIYLGEDILAPSGEDYFTTSVIEQSKQLEGFYDESPIQ